MTFLYRIRLDYLQRCSTIECLSNLPSAFPRRRDQKDRNVVVDFLRIIIYQDCFRFPTWTTSYASIPSFAWKIDSVKYVPDERLHSLDLSLSLSLPSIGRRWGIPSEIAVIQWKGRNGLSTCANGGD